MIRPPGRKPRTRDGARAGVLRLTSLALHPLGVSLPNLLGGRPKAPGDRAGAWSAQCCPQGPAQSFDQPGSISVLNLAY